MAWCPFKRTSDGEGFHQQCRRCVYGCYVKPQHPYLYLYTVTPPIRIRQRPGHPGSPDVLSANGSLHFGRYSEAGNGRVERFICQVQIYFRSYYSGFYHYVLASSNDLPTLYIARPTTKRHFAGD